MHLNPDSGDTNHARTARPRAAYVHVPFCRHRCGYCNFTLVAGRRDLVADYLCAIRWELASWGKPSPVRTLFFGGGTPTELPMSAFEQLSQSVLEQFPLEPQYEWSVEANPADVTPGYVARMADLGVNRISLGVQSLRAEKLRLLERDHDRHRVAAAVAAGRERIASISCDLIFGAPQETLADWKRDLDALLALEPDHISTYGLTYERGARFWARRARGELSEVDEEVQRAMYEHAIDRLTSAGYEHYEVSNFARPGHRCRHNEVYWLGEPWFAVGPGAASYVGGTRRMNHASTTTYLRRVLAGESPVAETETLGAEPRARERLVFGLRRLEGIERAAFAAETGWSVDELAGRELTRYVSLGLIDDDGQRIRLTREGLLISDSLWPALLA